MSSLSKGMRSCARNRVGTRSVTQTKQAVSISRRTHEVMNQSTPLVNFNLFTADASLQRSMKAFTSENPVNNALLTKHGAICGSEEIIQAGVLAERNRPTLRQFDTFGHRVDITDFHPAWHELMHLGKTSGMASYGFNNEATMDDSHVIRSAIGYLQGQVDPGHGCPLTMTNAAIPVLRRFASTNATCAEYVEKLLAQDYDGRNVCVEEKAGITAGMSMTEKQGGSDVRANTTVAVPLQEGQTGCGAAYQLTGHKWFTSAPMSDVFLTLAKTPKDLESGGPPSCFLVPRWIPLSDPIAPGERNIGFQVMRLKDKLADRSNASSEVEYDRAWGMMIGEEGKGVKTIIEMVQSTRLDCAVGSASTAKRALMEALHYTSNRSAFGAPLSHQPAMQNLLADLCVESEAHTLTAMRMARLFNDQYRGELAGSDSSSVAADTFRIGVAVSKYYITKRLPNFTYECMEAHGGNGFVEDFPMARMYRHAPLNSIWEGSGNVMTLDVLRAAKHLPLFLAEVKHDGVVGGHKVVNDYVSALERELFKLMKSGNASDMQRASRYLVDRMAVALQASVLLRYGCSTVAEMYVESRVHGAASQGLNYGSTVYSADKAQKVIDEHTPNKS